MTTSFVIDQTVREALDHASATRHLSSMPPDVVSLKLSGKSFGDASLPVLSAALNRIAPTLRHLDLSDVIASRPEDEAKRTLASIADALSSCTQLRSIDLSDNALGAKGINAILPLLSSQPHLTSLRLCNNGLAADAARIITHALLKRTPTTALTTLHFHNNLLETPGGQALAPLIENSPDLHDFRFTTLRLGRPGAVAICDALRPAMSANLRQLNLSDNTFGPEGTAQLASVLRNAPSLRVLLVNDVMLADQGVQLVCDALVEGAPMLEHLDISANEMAVEGAKGLSRLLAVGRLSHIKADDNELGNSGALLIAKGLVRSPTITHLSLSTCEIRSRGALALAHAASKVKSLELISLDANSFSQDALTQLETILGDRIDTLEENEAEHDDSADEETDNDEDDEDDADGANTDMGIKSGDTASNVDVSVEEEAVDDLVDNVGKLRI